MTLSILGSLTLGYRPLWNRARAMAGVQVFVHQDAPTTDGLHLLRTIDELWSAASPPLLLSVRTPELLADLLGQAAGGAPTIDVPTAWLNRPAVREAARQARQRGARLIASGSATEQPDAAARPWFERRLVSLSESDAVTALQVALRSRQGGPGRSMAGKSEDSPVRPDALIDGVASRALADHALDQQGAWAVAGWPLEDVLHRSDGEPTAPTRRGLVQAMAALDAEQSLDGIDHVIGQEPALAYRLLVYLNSPGLGLRNGVSSLRHGFMMLGFQKLNAWLSQQLPTASEDPDLRPVNAAMVLRGQLMAHLMDAGLEDDLRRELTLCGLFSQLDLVMNEPLRASFARIPVSGRIVDATIGNAGPYAPALRLAEALGLERPDALRALRLEFGMDAEEINRALLRTLAAIGS